MPSRVEQAGVADSTAQATRAAKAAFVQVTEEQLLRMLAAQPAVDEPELVTFDVVTDGAGASNGIVLFRLRCQLDGTPVEQDLVLRYMPGHQLLTQKSYADEFATVRALASAGMPVPEPMWLDADGSTLGCPGYVMERIAGRSPDAGMLLSGLLAEATPEDRRRMMLAAVGFHGRLRAAAIGPDAVPHLESRGRGDTAVAREVDWWLTEARLAAPAGDPKLVYLEELGEWMRRNEPPLRPATLVHGDAQIANVMFRDGQIAAVVDWELSYLGHSEADLALILFLTTTHAAAVPDIAGIPTTEEFIQRYEQEAGGEVEHLEYFTVLNFLKMLTIYLMLGDKLPDLEGIWSYHESLTNDARDTASRALG